MNVQEFLNLDLVELLSVYPCDNALPVDLNSHDLVSLRDDCYGIKNCEEHGVTHVFIIESSDVLVRDFAEDALVHLGGDFTAGLLTADEFRDLRVAVFDRSAEISHFFRPMRNRFRSLRDRRKQEKVDLEFAEQRAWRETLNTLVMSGKVSDEQLIEFHTCLRKVLYVNQADAVAVSTGSPNMKLTSYFCVHCTGYHLGHGKGKDVLWERKVRSARRTFLRNDRNMSVEFVKALNIQL